jgi:Putative Actinobacterial Holin-X, holin superfamily III
MDESTGAAQPPASDDRPAGELVKQLSEQVSRLVRDELRLAQLEMTRKGKRAGVGIGMAGGGGLIALYGLAALIAGAVIALSLVLAAWLAALIAGAGLLLIAAILALLGKRQLQRATPPVPAGAVGSIKADVEEIKERTRR